MRIVNTNLIENAVEALFIEANYSLPDSLAKSVSKAKDKEDNQLSKSILCKLEENMKAAKQENLPVCQDTGMAVLFAEIGNEVVFEGKSFKDAVNDGVAKAYTNGYLRKSIVKDPLFDRTNTGNNTPAIIYTEIVCGDKIKLTAAPKGFGSENMSAVKMFTPTSTKNDIIDFVLDVVKKAGGNPCPPIVVGIGIGGDFEYSAYLSKKALTRDIDVRNSDENYANMENEILEKINMTGIGPQGFGGRTTALAVNIEKYPTHIAGLPVAVNIGCHVTRHKSCIV